MEYLLRLDWRATAKIGAQAVVIPALREFPGLG
jgi:hypothetical protein